MIEKLVFLLLTSEIHLSLRVMKEEGSEFLQAEVGRDVSLICNYQMMGDSLYSIKWYRDDKEFFRYIPRESPPVTIFLIPGITVDDLSSPTHIIIKNVSLATSGSVKCEVSGGPPRFQTDESITQLQVVDLPSSGPKILGVDSKYHVGDEITASCISPMSFPPAVLSWYINSDSADPTFVSNQTRMTIHPDSPIFSNMKMKTQSESYMNQRGEIDRSIIPHEYFQSDTFYQHSSASQKPPRKRTPSPYYSESVGSPYSVLKLNFIVKRKHLKMTDGGLSLKCTAEVLDLYWRSSEVATQVTSLPHSWLLPAFSHSVAVNLYVSKQWSWLHLTYVAIVAFSILI